MRNKFLGTGSPGFHPLRKLRVCLTGLRYAVLFDFSVTYKVVLSTVVLAVCLYYHQRVDFLLVFAATGLMLMGEMFNTAVEALCDFVEAKENEKIGIIKDIAAAAAGIGILVWAVVVVAEVYRIF